MLLQEKKNFIDISPGENLMKVVQKGMILIKLMLPTSNNWKK
jgi:hypothetical protein